MTLKKKHLTVAKEKQKGKNYKRNHSNRLAMSKRRAQRLTKGGP
jgi:hypothetical protein